MIIGIDGRPANEAERAGIGALCRETLRALAPLLPPQSLRLYLDAAPRSDFPLSAKEAQFSILPKKRFWTQRVLAKELRKNPPDLFYSTTTQMPLLCACPTVPTILDLAYFSFPDQFTWKRRYSDQWALRAAIHKATHLIAISNATKKDLLTRFPISEDRITVAPLGVNPAFHPITDQKLLDTVRKRYQLPERYLLYLGRIQPRKNIVRLIQAYEICRQQASESLPDLVIAGAPGWLYEDIYAAAQASQYAPHIHFTGHIHEDSHIPALLSAAQAFAMISLWEGFGLPVLEAMACGVPVLTASTSSLPEVAGDAALLVDPYDTQAIAQAMQRILFESSLREKLIEEGKGQAEQFTWNATAHILLEQFEKLLEKDK